MGILTIDLGTTTGWCLRQGGNTTHGRLLLKGGRFEGGGMRFVRFRGHLGEIHKASPVGIVFYEEVRRHIGTDAAHVYGGLQAILQSWCEENAIPYEGVPVGTIKKFMTGSGNAKKDAMMAAARKFGFSPVDDNEADAIAIMLLKLEDPAVQAFL